MGPPSEGAFHPLQTPVFSVPWTENELVIILYTHSIISLKYKFRKIRNGATQNNLFPRPWFEFPGLRKKA